MTITSNRLLFKTIGQISKIFFLFFSYIIYVFIKKSSAPRHSYFCILVSETKWRKIDEFSFFGHFRVGSLSHESYKKNFFFFLLSYLGLVSGNPGIFEIFKPHGEKLVWSYPGYWGQKSWLFTVHRDWHCKNIHDFDYIFTQMYLTLEVVSILCCSTRL